MTKSTKTILWIVGIVIIVAVAIAATRDSNTDTGPIKIGFIGPLTGDAAAYGADTIEAAKIAQDEINNSGGINGRQIKIIQEDGKCQAKDGLSAAQKLITVDQVKFMVTSSCSGELLGYSNIAEQNKVLVLNSLASSPKITTAGDYIFRNDPNDNDGGKQLADLVTKKYKKVAVITENTEFSQGIKQVFVDTFTRNGGIVVSDEVYAPESTDFRSIVLKIKDTNPSKPRLAHIVKNILCGWWKISIFSPLTGLW